MMRTWVEVGGLPQLPPVYVEARPTNLLSHSAHFVIIISIISFVNIINTIIILSSPSWTTIFTSALIDLSSSSFSLIDESHIKWTRDTGGSRRESFPIQGEKGKIGCCTWETELLAILCHTDCRHSEILQLWISLKYQHFWASLKYCQSEYPQKSLTIPKAHLCTSPPLNMYVLKDTFYVPVTFLPRSASRLVRSLVRPPPVKQALCKMSVWFISSLNYTLIGLLSDRSVDPIQVEQALYHTT